MRQITQIEQAFLRDDVPEFSPGDTVRVHVRIKEGEKERIQVFQGTVISRRGGGTAETFTVRKISSGIGVERVFPLHSPNVAKIERVKIGQVRRAKLYYLRELTGKSARIKEELPSSIKAEKVRARDAAKAEEQARKKAEEEAAAKAKAEAEEAAIAAGEAAAKAEVEADAPTEADAERPAES